jgi:2-iminobutanoate/2-iminopropanoate deaminase
VSAETFCISYHTDSNDTYAESLEVRGASRMLFISGQIPTDESGVAPAEFSQQCRNAWRRIMDLLEQNDMETRNLVKVMTYLRDRADKDQNRQIRNEVLGDLRPSLTVVIVDLYEADWLVEIEAVAMA